MGAGVGARAWLGVRVGLGAEGEVGAGVGLGARLGAEDEVLRVKWGRGWGQGHGWE